MADEIRERHGMQTTADNRTDLTEQHSHIRITVVQPAVSASNQLTPAEARYLARKLYRLARRVEERSNG